MLPSMALRSAKTRKGLALGGKTMRPVKTTTTKPVAKRQGKFVEPERERLIERQYGKAARRTSQRRPKALPRPF